MGEEDSQKAVLQPPHMLWHTHVQTLRDITHMIKYIILNFLDPKPER